jgi:kynurenine formamidase
MYNGVPASAVTSAGATRNSIDQVDVKGIAGRAVLIDVAASLGHEHLPAATTIEPEHLDVALERQGVDTEPGDVVLIRTGWWRQLPRIGRDLWRAGCPGLSWRCGRWLHDRSIAAVAADNLAVEIVEFGVGGPEVVMPLHLLCLRDMGMMLGELWYLEDLAADCALDGVYSFHLVAAPLRVTGAVGSPVNPIAIK